MRDTVLLTVDSLRRDHLEVYNSTSPARTPQLSQFVEDGAIPLQSFWSAGGWTTPSMKAVLTGTDDVRHQTTPDLQKDSPYLPDILPNDVTTIGISTVIHLTRSTGFHQGFDHFEDFSSTDASHSGGRSWRHFLGDRADDLPVSMNRLIRTGYRLINCWRGELPFPTVDHVTSTLDSILSKESGRVFVWIHLMEPHTPFLPVDSINDHGAWKVASTHGTLETEQQRLSPAQRSLLRDLYAERVNAADQAVGAVLGCLHDHNRYEDLLIWVMADHGEELGERGWFGHGHMGAELNLYTEVCRVPSLIRIPEQAVVERLAGHIDVVSTIIDAYGLEPAGINGDSLLREESCVRRRWTMNHSQDGTAVAVSFEGMRYLRQEMPDDEVHEEFYDVKEDPKMKNDLIDTKDDEFRDVVSEAKSRIERLQAAGDNSIRTSAGAVEERLRDLGYS